MKKSTILLIAVVYIVSFLIVGFFGIAVKGYNKVIPVDSIAVIDPDNGLKIDDKSKYLTEEVKKDWNTDYYFTAMYDSELTVRLEARVLPADTTYPKVKLITESDYSVASPYTIELKEDVIAVITFKKAETTKVWFAFESTDGEKLQAKIVVIMYCF